MARDAYVPCTAPLTDSRAAGTVDACAAARGAPCGGPWTQLYTCLAYRVQPSTVARCAPP